MPLKNGLDYFPVSTEFFSDLSVLQLKSKHGSNGVLLYLQLLSSIYKEGYYVKFSTAAAGSLAVQLQVSPQFLYDVVRTCLRVGLFDKDQYNANHILTSLRIQEVYTDATKRRLRRGISPEHNLIDRVTSVPPAANLAAQNENVNILPTKKSKEKYTLPLTPSMGELFERESEPEGKILQPAAGIDNTQEESVNASPAVTETLPPAAAKTPAAPDTSFDMARFIEWWNRRLPLVPIVRLTLNQRRRRGYC